MTQAVARRRKRKIDDSISAEISAEEVYEIWRATKLRGTLPGLKTNQLVAEVMNVHRVRSLPVPKSLDTVRAVTTLLEDGPGDLALLGAQALEFRKLLQRLKPMAKAYHQGSLNGWQPVAVWVVWSVAAGILEELGETGGTSRSSCAVKFTAAAVKRMGWNGIDAPGIEALLKKNPLNGN